MASVLSEPAGPASAAAEPPSSAAVHHSWIGHHVVEGRAGRRKVVNPSTGEAFAEVSLLDEAQAASALEAARAAFPAWAGLSFKERGLLLLRLREEVLKGADAIAALVEREQGKPAAEAHVVEIFPSLEALQHVALHAEDLLRGDAVESYSLLLAHKDCRIQYAPLGPILIITPWNYPFAISMTGLATALAAGNTVVLKPAPATTLVGLRIGELCRRAGFPDGVVSVVATDDTVAGALVEDPRVAKVVFTGSTSTGRKVMTAAAKNLTPVVLELGGKDAAVVCRDADLDRAARGIVWGAFVNAGQTCASVERVYVEEAVAEPFLARVVEETRRLRTGNAGAGEMDMGPLTLDRQRTIVAEHVQDAVARGAKVLTGGEAPEGPGYFYPPTVLANVDHEMRVMREETFGPVLPVMSVASLDDAIRLANDSEYGLTASAWTRDPATADRLARELNAGVVTVNDCVYSFAEPTAPWGGVKQSGIGRTHGLLGLREMVQVKYVARDFGSGPNLWWYPYGAEFQSLMSTANRAMHQGGVITRLPSLLRLASFRRFWQRVRIGGLIRNLDKMFH